MVVEPGTKPAAVVIGVGNPHLRDDGVGPAVIDRLRARGVAGVTLVESDGEAAALIALWDRRPLAILVDAVLADPPHPGRVHRLLVPRPCVERIAAARAHGMDLGGAVEMGRTLGRLPDHMVVYAIEAADVSTGPGLTEAVAAAADRVAADIADRIAVLVREPAPADHRPGDERRAAA